MGREEKQKSTTGKVRTNETRRGEDTGQGAKILRVETGLGWEEEKNKSRGKKRESTTSGG